MVWTISSPRREQRHAELQSLALFSRQLLWGQYRHVLKKSPHSGCSADDAIAEILAAEFPPDRQQPPPQKLH